MGDHVFICYSRKDQDFVIKVATNLKGQGIPVWLDHWDIPHGANWPREIDKSLSECACLLLVLSPASVESDEVQSEWYAALDEKKVVIPILYQSCHMPFRLRLIQHIDFTSRSPDDIAALNEVLLALEKAQSTLSRPKETPVNKEKHSVPSSKAFDPEEALRLRYEEAAELEPIETMSTLEKDAEAKAWNSRGWDFAAEGQFDEAIKAYDRAVELNPQYAKAWKNKANVLYDQKSYDEAIKAFDKALEINPQDPYVVYSKGYALKMLGRNSDANAFFARAKELGYKD